MFRKHKSGGAHRDQLQGLCVFARMHDPVSIMSFSGPPACSRVAKAAVCPQALRALREQSLAFSREKRQDLHQNAAWPREDRDQVSAFCLVSLGSTTKVTCNPGFHLLSAHFCDCAAPSEPEGSMRAGIFAL